MSRTNGLVEMDTPSTDGQFFIGASAFDDLAAVATLASASAGLLSFNIASTAAANFFTDVVALMRRTGMFATPNLTQEQYGTAASVPGPSSVSGTNSPDGVVGFPPFLAAAMPTLVGPVAGAIKKGFRVTSFDVIYEVNTVNAALAQVGYTVTQFLNAVAPTVTNRVALAANGLPTAFNAAGTGRPYVTNVAVPSPVFSTASDGESVINVKLTAGSGGTIKFYGVVLHVDFNLN